MIADVMMLLLRDTQLFVQLLIQVLIDVVL